MKKITITLENRIDLLIIRDALIAYALNTEAKINNISIKSGINTECIAINRQLAEAARRIAEMFEDQI